MKGPRVSGRRQASPGCFALRPRMAGCFLLRGELPLSSPGECNYVWNVAFSLGVKHFRKQEHNIPKSWRSAFQRGCHHASERMAGRPRSTPRSLTLKAWPREARYHLCEPPRAEQDWGWKLRHFYVQRCTKLGQAVQGRGEVSLTPQGKLVPHLMQVW